MHNNDATESAPQTNSSWPPASSAQNDHHTANFGQYSALIYRFKFHGQAAEYFGIWIVNILLTIVTLSFYSPWAKVRRLRYFYQNTELLERRFDFTGIPTKILLGRLVAIGIWVGISVAGYWSTQIAAYGVFAIYLAIPWLMRCTLRFTARNSKFGNSRFYFSGSTLKAYGQFFLGIAITLVTLGLFAPVFIWLYKRYSADHLYVGQLQFKLNNSWFDYMTAIYVPMGIAFVFGVIWMVLTPGYAQIENLTGLYIALLMFGYLALILFIFPWVQARIYITTWNSITVGHSQFKTECNQWRYTWIVSSNWMLCMLSLGLMTPWAAIRLRRYQVDSMCLYLHDDPDQMMNMAQTDHSAIAEEISDIFDFDLSL